MRFLFPSLFYFWAALIAVPIVLYLFRPRPKTIRTSTLPFFKWLAREHQDSTWLKRLKYLLSLLVCIVFILLISSALGKLVAAPGEDDVKTLVILVDRSASMAADDGGQTRIEKAKTLVQKRIAGIPAGVGVIVMAYDNRAEVLLSRSYDLRQVRRAVASIDVRPVASNAESALQLAQQLSKLETPATIWHVTDQTPSNKQADTPSSNDKSDVTDREQRPEVKHFNIATSGKINAGITAMQLRRLPLEPDKFEVFVQVHASAIKPVEAQLEVKLDGELVGVRKLTIKPNEKEAMLIPVQSSSETSRKLSLAITAEDDILATDNHAYARVPRHEPLKVLWIAESPDPFTELALSSLAADGALDILQGKPSAWPPKEPVDVVLLDGWLPKKWPDNPAVIIMKPPRSLGPLQVAPIQQGVPLASVRATDEDHPLLFGVSTARVAVTQTAIVDGSGLLQPVWVGSQGPVLLAGQSSGQRVAVLAFSAEQSEQLPLMASYPLLVGNALYWVSQSMLEKTAGMNRRSGDILNLASKQIMWENADRPNDVATERLTGRSVELSRTGWWKTPDGTIGSASLLSERETLIATTDRKEADSQSTLNTSFLSGDLVPVIMWIVFIGLIVESLLYHRYWIF